MSEIRGRHRRMFGPAPARLAGSLHPHHNATASIIDPTKLKSSAFIAGLSAWYLTDLGRDDLPELLAMIEQGSLRRASDLLAVRRGKSEADAAGITRAPQVELSRSTASDA